MGANVGVGGEPFSRRAPIKQLGLVNQRTRYPALDVQLALGTAQGVDERLMVQPIDRSSVGGALHDVGGGRVENPLDVVVTGKLARNRRGQWRPQVVPWHALAFRIDQW